MKLRLQSTWISVALIVLFTSHAGTAMALNNHPAAATCEEAKAIGELSVPMSSLRRQELGEQGDYFAFLAEPGTYLTAYFSRVQDADESVITLFDSKCQFLAQAHRNLTDLPDFDESHSELMFRVPDDGRFVIGISGYPDFALIGDAYPGLDWEDDEGDFLSVFESPEPRVITGRTNGFRDTTLPMHTRVTLYHCEHGEGQGCVWRGSTVAPDSDGKFEIVAPSNTILHVCDDGVCEDREFGGHYLLKAWATVPHGLGLEPRTVALSYLAPGERRTVSLTPRDEFSYPHANAHPSMVRLGQVSPCTNVPATGGTCAYNVEVVNETDQRLRASSWSNVNAIRTGSGLGHSTFTVESRGTINVREFRTGTARFSFDIPADVAEGGVVCVDAWLTERQNPTFGPLAQKHLFCLKREGLWYSVIEHELQ